MEEMLWKIYSPGIMYLLDHNDSGKANKEIFISNINIFKAVK